MRGANLTDTSEEECGDVTVGSAEGGDESFVASTAIPEFCEGRASFGIGGGPGRPGLDMRCVWTGVTTSSLEEGGFVAEGGSSSFVNFCGLAAPDI